MDHTTRITCRNCDNNSRCFSNANTLYCAVTCRQLLTNKGFVTTAALTILPIFIFSGLSVFGSLWFIEQKEKIQWICETQNLEAQNTLVQSMRQLLILNPIVESLVLQKKFVQLALLASPTPIEKAALTAQLLVLNLKLSSASAKQSALILSTHIKAGQDIARLRQKIQHHLSKMERVWHTHLNVHFSTSRPFLRLRKKKIDTLGHVFLEHPLLQEQQKIKVHIVIFGERLFPKWLRWLTTQPLRWHESCTTQPKKEFSLWSAKILMDKL